MKRRWRISGQAIVEVVLAAGLVLVALTVLVAAVSKAVAANRLSKERVIATRLAQETVEWFNGMRGQMSWSDFCDPIGVDQNFCAGPGFLEFLNPGSYDVIFIDSGLNNNVLGSCNARSDVIRSKTNYQVYIYINNSDKNCSIDGTVEFNTFVTWVSLGKTQTVTLHSVLGGL